MKSLLIWLAFRKNIYQLRQVSAIPINIGKRDFLGNDHSASEAQQMGSYVTSACQGWILHSPITYLCITSPPLLCIDAIGH